MPLDLVGITFTYDGIAGKHQIFDDLSFHVDDGQFVALLGPTGCGKSTLIRVIAGFTKPSTGVVLLDGEEVKTPGSDRGVILQQNSLFPWMTIEENITYPLRVCHTHPSDCVKAAGVWLEQLELTTAAQLYPDQVSAGMQQMTALARLFVSKTKVCLMDEPFGSLDTISRTHAQKLLLRIWERERRTVIFVTHDVEEALFLADRIIVFGGQPTRIIAEHVSQLPRPRNYEQIFGQEFIDNRHELLHLIGALEQQSGID